MATLEEIRKSLGLEEPKEDDRLTAVRASLGLEQAEAPIPPRKPPPPAPAYAPIPQPQKPRLAPKYSQFGQSLEANVRGIRGGAAGLAGDVLSEAGIAPRTSERLGRFAGREQELERQAQTMLTTPDYRDIKDWEGFFDWLGAGAGAAAAQLPYFVTAHTLGGPAGTVGAALPLSYSEVKGASKQAGIDPLKQYNIPGTGIELTGRQMQMIGALPHAGIEVFGLQRYLGGNSSFVSSLIQELGEEAAQYLVAEAVASAQKNRDVIPFVKESFEAGKLKEAGAQMINAIPQVTFMMGVTGAAKNLADRATAAERPPQARPAPAAAPVAPPPVSPTPETPAPPQPPPAKPYVSPFREHKIRDIPERPEAPLRRPGVPGEPFRREAPAAPEAPPPAPPGPPAPPAPPATVEPPVTAPGEPASWATVRMVVANDLASQKDVLTALTVITRLAADPKTREAARWKEQKSLAEALHRKARELGATKEQINRAQSDEVVWPRVFAPEPTVEPSWPPAGPAPVKPPPSLTRAENEGWKIEQVSDEDLPADLDRPDQGTRRRVTFRITDPSGYAYDTIVTDTEAAPRSEQEIVDAAWANIQTDFLRRTAAAPDLGEMDVVVSLQTPAGRFDVSFFDTLHRRVFDLGAEPTEEAAEALLPQLLDWVEGVTTVEDVMSLARDYREEVLDSAETGAQAGRSQPEPADIFIDPDAQNEYFRRHARYRAAPTQAPPPAPAPTVEPTEQGPQTVIPGAERISDKEAIERKADERIKPKVPQAPMDEGIFDTGARKQGDLIDEIKRVKPEPERDEIDRYLNILRGARAMPKKPKTMTQWVKEAGGVTDPQGEIKQIIGQASARPGLINNKSGKDIDDMALLAWEAGFFPDAAERPDVRTFLDALAADARGESVRIDPRDAELSAEWDAIADLDELLNQLDIDVKALKNDEIKHLIESESLPPEAFSGRPGTRASWMPGGRYVGAVEQKFEPDRERRKAKDIRRREDILRPLLKDLGVPLYQGRLKSRKLLGRYKRKIEEVRIKNMNDIEVAAHELAHMLDDRFPEIRKQWLPATKANKAIREELRGVSYDASKLYEGFAEFVRLWATQKQKALEAAPQFYSWFEGFLGRNKHGPALRRAQAEMHDWFAQDQVSQLASKIGVQESINAGLSTRWQRWRQGIFDDLRRIYDAEKKVSGDINDVGPYVTARLTRSKYAMIEGVLKLGQIKIAGAGERYLQGAFYFEGKSLVDILTPIGANLDDWLYYSVARSARELKQQGRERLLTNAEIEAGLALETPAFDQAFNDYQEWNKSIVDFAVAKGAINPEKRAKWARSQYIPFYRAGSRTPQATGRPTGDWKGIKRLTGGTQNLRPILDNIIGNASMLIDAALTNEARVKVADLVEGPQGAHFMTEVPKDNAKVLVLKESIREAAKENISRQIDAELQKAIKKGDEAEVDLAEKADQQREWMEERVDELFDEIPGIYLAGLMEIPPRGDKIVAVLRGGEPTYYEVIDDLMYSSLKRLNRPPKHWITRVLAFPKRLGQASITFSIDFMMRNISRDTIMGLVMSKSGFIPWYDSIRGMASRIYQDENYRLAIANGVGFSSYLVDEDAMRSHISKFASREGINPSTILDTPAKFILAVERLADAFEMSTRLGEFRRAVEAGVHPRQAAYRAREVSTDFAMRGDWDSVGFAYDTIIFLKAAMNSWDRLYRGLTEDTNRGKIAGLSASIAMASIALYLVNRGNPGYDDLEDWEKDAYWHFFVGDQHFRYPKIWEIGAMASIAERTVEKFLDGQPEQLAADYWRIMRDVMNVEYMPQAVAPLFEQAINRIRFIDRPIETQSMQELDPALRIGPRTSETLRALGKAERKLPPELQVSPVRVEALLRGYLNTWALYGLTMSDAMFFDDQPDLSIHEYPVFRTFWPKPAEKRHTRYETEFYDAVRDASQLRRNVRQALNLWGRDIAREYAEDPRQALRPFLNTQKKTMDAINDNTNRIRNMRSLEELRTYAEAIGRGQMGPQVRALQQTEAWNHKGKLKAELLDMWSAKRSAFAKQSMQQLQKMRQRQKEMP